MILTAENIARELGRGVETGHGDRWNTLCPSHDEKSPSFVVSEKDGRILVHCHAGCSQHEVIESLKRKGLWPTIKRTRDGQSLQSLWARDGLEYVCHYEYESQKREVLMVNVRLMDPKTGKKTFRQARPYLDGRWKKKTSDVRKVLYRLPDLITAIKAGKTIVILEGEKDVDNFNSQPCLSGRYFATTSINGGRARWKKEYNYLLKSAEKVVGIPDNDWVGYNHIADIGLSLHEDAKPFYYVELLGVGKGGDVSDFLEVLPSEQLLYLLDNQSQPWLRSFVNPHPKEEPKKEPGDPPNLEVTHNVIPMKTIDVESIERWTDTGNGKRIVKHFGKDIRFAVEYHRKRRDGWFVWNKKFWEHDTGGLQMEVFAREAIKQVISEPYTDEEAGKVKKLIQTGLNVQGYRNAITAAASLGDTKFSINDFDADPFKLNCKNGVVDLTDGDIVPHDRSFFCSKISPIDYQPAAPRPKFEKFLETIFDGDKEIIQFLKRLLGYSITGSNDEHKIAILYGDGGNGKSTLMKIMSHILGTYATSTRAEAWMKRYTESKLDSLADLVNVRFIWTGEVAENDKLNESRVKEFTSGDPQKAAELYHDAFNFTPIGHLFMPTNYKPRIQGMDEGIWRRILLIPFNVEIKETIKGYDQIILDEEASGILSWLVEGAVEWKLSGGLHAPNSVKMATDDYRTDEDTITQFLEERTKRMEGLRVGTSDLYGAYTKFCDFYRCKRLNNKVFVQEMEKRGYEKKIRRGRHYYMDIVLLHEDPGGVDDDD